jgi:transposase-like protein
MLSTKGGKQMASKGQKFKKIPLETRQKAVQERLKEGKSYNYLGEKYGVSKETIRTWVRIYKRDGGLDVRSKGRQKEDGSIDYKERYEILKKYQDYLGEVDRDKK